jgi:dTDP-4-amino-4,6-dideoxygalactose transaminase
MSDIQASLGLAQLARLDELQRRRAEIYARYNAAFSRIPGLQLPAYRDDVEHARHRYVLRLRNGALRGGRDEMMARLKERGIHTSVHFVPVHLHTFYREKYGYQADDFPVALDNFQRMLNLPLSPALTDDDVSRVIDTVSEICKRGVDRNAA